SSSSCKSASARHATLAECRCPSVSTVPASNRCRSRASAWSALLPRLQCNGCPGLCWSFPALDSAATAAQASGKYHSAPFASGMAFLALGSVGRPLMMAPPPSVEPAPDDVATGKGDGRKDHPNPKGIRWRDVEAKPREHEPVGYEVDPEANGDVGTCLDEGRQPSLCHLPPPWCLPRPRCPGKLLGYARPVGPGQAG